MTDEQKSAFGVELSQEITNSLTSAAIETGNNEVDLCKLAGQLASFADAGNTKIIVELEQIARAYLDADESPYASHAINLLIECSAYHELLGHPDRSLELAEIALIQARETNNLPLQRRAHNALGVFYTKTCNFKKACIHLEKSISLALTIGDENFVLASMCNAVTLLQSIGLYRAAMDLAFDVAKKPRLPGPNYSLISIQNANNGLKLALMLGDLPKAAIFYRISSEEVAQRPEAAGKVSLSYFESSKALYLVAQGSEELAKQSIEQAILRASVSVNSRAIVLLRCAEAEVHLALCDREKIQFSRSLLESYLVSLDTAPETREELLRTLVRLYTESFSKIGKTKAARYLSMLREHLVGIKHHCFYLESSREIFSNNRPNGLQDPTYELPAWAAQSGLSYSENTIAINEDSNKYRKNMVVELVESVCTKNELKFRSRQYDIAENWAVSVEFSSEGSGYHCFRVGFLAHVIGMELGMSRDACMILELACRLHDIGKVVLGFPESGYNSLRSLGQYSIICEHTIAGEKLLSASSEKTMRLAGLIAKNHHEWWNGCGYPSGKRGDEIPREARICAIADAFVSLIFPPKGTACWEFGAAFNQVVCMAGVQIDPSLIVALSNALKSKDILEALGMTNSDGRFSGNEFANAKARLFVALEAVH